MPVNKGTECFMTGVRETAGPDPGHGTAPAPTSLPGRRGHRGSSSLGSGREHVLLPS